MQNDNKNSSSRGTASADQATDQAKRLKEDAASKVGEVRDAAAEMASEEANAVKGSAAEEMRSIGDALRTAAGEVREGSPQERTFAYMADALADLSDTVRSKDIGEMVKDVSQFARRNPAAFLGGAALLGFAGMRAARASQRNPSHDDPNQSSHSGADSGSAYGSAGSAYGTAGGTSPQPVTSGQSTNQPTHGGPK